MPFKTNSGKVKNQMEASGGLKFQGIKRGGQKEDSTPLDSLTDMGEGTLFCGFVLP